MARLTGLEPATPGVTGRYSNQLSYNRVTVRLGNRRGGVNGTTGGFRIGPFGATARLLEARRVGCAVRRSGVEQDNKWGKVARLTGLEPATPGVTGRYSNQLSYNRVRRASIAPRLPRQARIARARAFYRRGAAACRTRPDNGFASARPSAIRIALPACGSRSYDTATDSRGGQP